MARTFDWPASSFGFCRDTRPLNDQLRVIAELGAIAPEALLLSEIRMLCSAFLGTPPESVTSPCEREQRDELVAV